MTDKSIYNHDMIDRYLRRQLDEQELALFEVSIIEDQDLLQEVQQREAMVDALRRESHSLEVEQPPQSFNFIQWLRQPYSVAASLVTTVSLVLLISFGGFSLSGDPTGGAFNIASNLTLEGLRGNANAITSQGDGPVLLTVDVGPVDPLLRFSLAIVNETSGQEVVNYTGLNIDDQGWLRVLINESFYGMHRIEVTREDNGESMRLAQVNFLTD